MFFPKLSQISTQGVVTLADHHTIQDAASLMDQQSLRDVVITGDAGFRMVTARELITFRLQDIDFSSLLSQVDLQMINSINQDATVIDGLTALKEGTFEYLCLLDKSKNLTGIVSYSDMAVHLDPYYLSEFKRIDDLVHLTDFMSVDASETIKNVLVLMHEHQQTAALIKAVNGEHLGIVTQKDITHAIAQQRAVDSPVDEIMVSPLITIDGQASLQQALSFSREQKLKRLVVTHQGSVIGLLHQKDLVALVYEKWRNLLAEQQRHVQAERALFKNGPVLLFIWQPEGYWPVKFVSDNVKEILGYTPDELMREGFEFGQIVHPDDLEKTSSELTQALQNKVAFLKQTYRVLDKQGAVHWVYDYSRPSYDEQGTITNVFGYLLDQTEQIETKMHAQQAQEKLELALEASETGLWVWDMQANQISWSDQAFIQLGYAPQAFEVTLERFQAYLHPDDVSPMFAQIQQQIAQHKGFNVEFRFKNGQGGWSWLQGRGKVTKSNAQGEPIEMMGVHLDIGATKKAEKKLRSERQRLENIIWGTGVGTWEWNVQTGETIFNERWAEIVGITLDEIQPTTIDTWMFFAHPDDLAESGRKLTAHFNGEVDHYEVEARLRHKNGDWIWVLDRGKVVSWTDDGKPEWMAGTHQEITEQKNKQQALAKAQLQAEAANQAKSEFLANMSHEIRTPMNGIIGLSELAMKQDDVEVLHEQLDKIYRSGRLLLGIINDVLDFSKIEAGKLEIDPQPFFVCKLVDGLASLFATSLEQKPIEFLIDSKALINQAFVADSMRLRQVLLNVIGNAIKFTEQGEVRLTISEYSDQHNQAWLGFEVKDSGIGMSSAQQKKLFQAFSQADNSITRKHGGTGLGLVISQRLIDLMGGDAMTVDSELGQGSRFSFRIPVQSASAEQQSLLKQENQNVQAKYKLKGHVLLVEDNEINQEVATNQLSDLGIEVTLAENGQLALDLVRQQHFDLVLMDIQMPVMDGYQATRAIREFDQDTPIIALTAAAMIEDKKKAMSSGMNGHLSKPINLAELRLLLSNYLSAVKPSLEPLAMPQALAVAPVDNELINLQKGLVQLNGNLELYDRLLAKFVSQLTLDYAELVDDLTQLLANDPPTEQAWSSLQTRNHALKGVAGNLAIDALYEQSRQLDVLLKQKQKPTPEGVSAFSAVFSATLLLLNERAHSSAHMNNRQPEQPLDDDGVKALIIKLHALLQRIQNSEYIDESEWQALSYIVPQNLNQNWLECQQKLDDFEFEQAAESLKKLISNI